jgi:hypothetical protein
MYKNILQSIDNVEIWPIISLVMFFLLFVGVLIYVLKTDNEFIRKMKELPFDDNIPDEKKKIEK